MRLCKQVCRVGSDRLERSDVVKSRRPLCVASGQLIVSVMPLSMLEHGVSLWLCGVSSVAPFASRNPRNPGNNVLAASAACGVCPTILVWMAGLCFN